MFRKLYDWLAQRMNLKRFFKFCVSGITASVAEIVIFAVLASWLLMNTFLANGIAIAISMIIGYLMNRHYTFRHRHPHPSSLLLYVLLNAWDVVFSSWLIDLIAVADPWHKVPAKILTLLICAGWNYYAYKRIIFRHYEKQPSPANRPDEINRP